MKDITDADYAHAKGVYKDFGIKNLREYHDLYVQNHALLLPNVIENFRKMCLKIYKHGLQNFFLLLVNMAGCFKKA